jgi:hypothetical protein
VVKSGGGNKIGEVEVWMDIGLDEIGKDEDGCLFLMFLGCVVNVMLDTDSNLCLKKAECL